MSMRIEPEIGSCMIVLIGRFSPLIFSPLWFARNNLVSQEVADSAHLQILHEDIAILKLGKIQLQVEGNRLSAETTEAPWIDLCDFIAKTFTEALASTPVNQIGINRLVHYSVGSEERRNKIGLTLAPVEPWGDFGTAIAASTPPKRGGALDVTMILPTFGEGYTGHMQVSVQPSGRIKGNLGIYVQTNDHYNVGRLDETTDCMKIMSILVEKFERSVQFSETIIDQIMSLGEEK